MSRMPGTVTRAEDERYRTRLALANVEGKLARQERGQEMAGSNPLERRIDELQAIVSALRERVDIISDWHLRLMDRLNELGASVKAPIIPNPNGSFAEKCAWMKQRQQKQRLERQR